MRACMYPSHQGNPSLYFLSLVFLSLSSSAWYHSELGERYRVCPAAATPPCRCDAALPLRRRPVAATPPCPATPCPAPPCPASPPAKLPCRRRRSAPLRHRPAMPCYALRRHPATPCDVALPPCRRSRRSASPVIRLPAICLPAIRLRRRRCSAFVWPQQLLLSRLTGRRRLASVTLHLHSCYSPHGRADHRVVIL